MARCPPPEVAWGGAQPIRIAGLRQAVLGFGLLALAGCRIEDHTPTGTRRDEDTIQQLLSRYARRLSQQDWSGVRSLFWDNGTFTGPISPGDPSGGRQAIPIDSALRSHRRWLAGVEPEHFDIRLLRTDLRQEGDLAAAWLVTRRRTPAGSTALERDWTEHVVLRRIDGEWRILTVAVASEPRRRTP